jgi:hypothetical protein
VARHLDGRALGIFGEPRVNVLALNLSLERAYPRRLTPQASGDADAFNHNDALIAGAVDPNQRRFKHATR